MSDLVAGEISIDSMLRCSITTCIKNITIMKKKLHNTKPSCPYSKTLKKMPPLMHRQPNSTFFISKSQIVRFILFAMKLDPDHRRSWKKACTVFHQAKISRVIQFDHETLTWSGISYQPGMNDPRIRELVRKVKTWKPRDRNDPRRK